MSGVLSSSTDPRLSLSLSLSLSLTHSLTHYYSLDTTELLLLFQKQQLYDISPATER